MNLKIEAAKREIGKKSDLNEMRRNGLIPAVIYGEGKPGVTITVKDSEFKKAYRKSLGHMAFFDVTIDGEEYRTIVKEKQIHPVSREVLHIDFQELHAGKEISIEVPLTYVGDAPGVHAGGILDYSLRTLLCSSLPKNIREDITVDISKLEVGEAIHVGDLELGEMTAKMDDEQSVVSIHMPRSHKTAEDKEEESEGEEAAEAPEE